MLSTKIPAWPIEITFIMPMRFEAVPENAGANVFHEAQYAINSKPSNWKLLENPIRRGGPPERDGWAFGEFAYFHPYFQDFLYGPSSRIYEFDPEKAKRFEVRSKRLTTTLDIRGIHLYLFEDGSGMLVTELVLPDSCPEDKKTWDDALDTIAELRKTYYSHYFPQNGKEGEPGIWAGGGGIGEVWISPLQKEQPNIKPGEIKKELQSALRDRRPSLFPHWREVLEPFTKDGARVGVRLLGDNRMAVMAFIGTPAIAKLSDDDWESLAQADGSGFSHYAPEFREAELKRSVYDRWYSPRTFLASKHRYLAGPLSFCSVVQVEPGNAPDWLDSVREKWRRQYFQIFLFANYQLAALRILQHQIARASDRIAEAADASPEDRGKAMQALQNIERVQLQLARFSSRAWFLEITPQIQGQELYELIRRQFRLDALYREVMDDKSILSDWIAAHAARKREQILDRATEISVWFVAGTLLLTFLGMSVLLDPIRELLLKSAHRILLKFGWLGIEGATPFIVQKLLADLTITVITATLAFHFLYRRLRGILGSL